MAALNEEVISERARIVQDDSGKYHYFRDDIELEKGILLNRQRVDEQWDVYTKWMNYFTAYPDKFIELITPAESTFKLFFYQKIFLRACLRYRYHYCTAPRAFSKTFVSILAMVLKCIFQPGSKCFICAPKKEQSAKIAKEKNFDGFRIVNNCGDSAGQTVKHLHFHLMGGRDFTWPAG